VILINKNSVNTRILTLSEKTSITDACYLFEVTNDNSKAVKYFIAADTSINPERYNEFDFIENTTENLQNGTFSLPLTGFYKYKVYEQASGSTNLNPIGLTEIDNGKLLVKDTVVADLQYAGNTNEEVVYNG
jgi:hypothetical protein